ncbi:MAG TPA: hypothetical protein VFW78_08615 [Bacteroidia bacterium]|nr:hypothetical protein [Bacteroidia bacterium]
MKPFLKYSLAPLIAICLLFACNKDEDNTSPMSTSGEKVKTTIVGTLIDVLGDPVVGATVTVEGMSTVTTPLGIFLFENINVDSKRLILSFKKAGKPDQLYACKPVSNEVTYVKPVMIEYEYSQVIAANTGGTVTTADGAAVVFPSNAFADASGQVISGNITVKMNLINHDDTNFSTIVPGRDLRAKDAAGDDKILFSYGMINVELYDAAGQKVYLAPGVTAQLVFPITSAEMGSAPATIPLWYLDTQTALWKEDGTATRNGNTYSANVSHFTWWNCDYPYPLATLQGRVMGCNNSPVANAIVYCNAYQAYVTDNMGYFWGDAPAQYNPFQVYGYKSSINNGSNYTQYELIPVLAAGQTYTVPDLIFSSGMPLNNTFGKLVDCNGNNQSGLVVVTEPGTNNYDYFYVNAGKYSLSLVNGTTYNFTALKNSLYGQISATINAPSNCDVDSLNDLALCNATFPANTNFQLSIQISGLGTFNSGYYATNCSAAGNATTHGVIIFSAIDSANNSSGLIKMNTDSYSPGTFTWDSTNAILINVNLNGTPVTIVSDTPGSSDLVITPSVGGYVTGSFSGIAIATSPTFPWSAFPAVISGSFEVKRDQ